MLIYTVISVTALVTVHYTPFTKKRENFKRQFLRSFLVTKENIRFILPLMIYILLSILYTHEVHVQVHASVFFCTFLCRQARLRRESAYFHALQSYFASLNSPPGKLANRTKPSFIRQLCLCLESIYVSLYDLAIRHVSKKNTVVFLLNRKVRLQQLLCSICELLAALREVLTSQ